MQHRFISIIVLLILGIPAGVFNTAQETGSVIDTSEYMPGADGLNFNLAVAASKGYAYEIHRLVKLGADPDAADVTGATPIIYAVANNMKEAVTALLTYEPELNFLTPAGESPLLIAARYNLLEIGESLIRRGADINFKDYYGAAPLHYAAIYDYLYFTDMLIYYEADRDIRSSDGTTPLMGAVWGGNAEVTDLLIQSGADPSVADNDGFTPLILAAQNGDTLIADLLLRNGASLYSINIHNVDALGISIRSNHQVMTEYLLKKIRMDPPKADTPLPVNPVNIATSYGRKEIVELLNRYGIDQKPPLTIDRITFTGSAKVNIHDLYTGGEISFTDPYHRLRFNVGADFKPWYTRVLDKVEDNLFYQYMDKRYVLYGGITKYFILSENYLKGDYTLDLTLNAGYMFSSTYPGTYVKPDNRLAVMPSVNIRWTKGSFSILGGVEYMGTGLYKAGPVWFRAGLSYNFLLQKVKSPLKNIKWY
ncbi:MAG: ankyrin repeat domain-containing protein [Bacteroidales bacterium]